MSIKIVVPTENQKRETPKTIFGIPITHGGSGSGNFGHSGRPGEVGGSGGGGGDQNDLDARKRYRELMEKGAKAKTQFTPQEVSSFKEHIGTVLKGVSLTKQKGDPSVGDGTEIVADAKLTVVPGTGGYEDTFRVPGRGDSKFTVDSFVVPGYETSFKKQSSGTYSVVWTKLGDYGTMVGDRT